MDEPATCGVCERRLHGISICETMLTGQRAIVTGANSGIGEGIARGLAEAGAKVVINRGHGEDQAARVAEDIRAAGGEALAIRADVSDEEQVPAVFDRTVAEFGSVDILVNNAGLQQNALFHAMTYVLPRRRNPEYCPRGGVVRVRPLRLRHRRHAVSRWRHDALSRIPPRRMSTTGADNNRSNTSRALATPTPGDDTMTTRNATRAKLLATALFAIGGATAASAEPIGASVAVQTNTMEIPFYLQAGALAASAGGISVDRPTGHDVASATNALEVPFYLRPQATATAPRGDDTPPGRDDQGRINMP